MIPPCAQNELQSVGRLPANIIATGILWVSAAIRAAADPATPDPITKSRSSGRRGSWWRTRLLGVASTFFPVVDDNVRLCKPRRQRLLPLHIRDLLALRIILLYGSYKDQRRILSSTRTVFSTTGNGQKCGDTELLRCERVAVLCDVWCVRWKFWRERSRPRHYKAKCEAGLKRSILTRDDNIDLIGWCGRRFAFVLHSQAWFGNCVCIRD